MLQDLWEKVSPGGFFVLMEPGSPMGFRFVNDARNIFIEKSREEANIVAPCPHQMKCPLASKAKTWCNFDQLYERYPKDVLTKAPTDRMNKTAHFSYIIVKKGPLISSILDARTPQERSLFWPRVIRPSVIKEGHVIIDMCNTQGELERRVISKCHNEDDKAYKYARKVNWGDLWPLAKRIPNKFRKASIKGKRLW